MSEEVTTPVEVVAPKPMASKNLRNRKEYEHQYYGKHRDRILARNKCHYEEHKAEKLEYRQQHRDKQRQYDKEYYLLHKDKIKERKRKRYAHYREEIYARDLKRIYGSEERYTEAMLKYDGECAFACGRQADSVHHMDGKSIYNSPREEVNNDLSNLLPLCNKCHPSLHNKKWGYIKCQMN